MPLNQLIGKFKYTNFFGLSYCNKNPIMYSFSGNCAASVPISTVMCLWAIIYSQDRSTYFVGIYKSLTDTWMWKLGLWPCKIPFLGIFVLNFRYCVFAVLLCYIISLECSIYVYKVLIMNLWIVMIIINAHKWINTRTLVLVLIFIHRVCVIIINTLDYQFTLEIAVYTES